MTNQTQEQQLTKMYEFHYEGDLISDYTTFNKVKSDIDDWIEKLTDDYIEDEASEDLSWYHDHYDSIHDNCGIKAYDEVMGEGELFLVTYNEDSEEVDKEVLDLKEWYDKR